MTTQDLQSMLEMGVAGFGLRVNSQIVASTASVVVKSGPGMIFGIEGFNTSSTAAFVKFFDTSSPTVGVTVPVFRVQIPPVASGPLIIPLENGKTFGTAISVAVTGGIADSDTSAPATNT